MAFFLISVLAGILTVLAPCIFPLLPIVIGSSEPGKQEKGISRRAIVVIISLSVSVIVFTLLLKATTLFITIPQSFWAYFSGAMIILVGLAILFPTAWARIPLASYLSRKGDKALKEGRDKQSIGGDIVMGAALGPVFTSCSPTYLFIIATVLPASFAVGLIYLAGFTIGLAFSLLLIAYLGQQIVRKVMSHSVGAERVKKFFGVLILLVGIAIFTGYDKKLETYILDSGYGATINFESELIERFRP